MKLSIVNPKGIVFEGDTSYVVVDGNNGQLAILENHIPIVVPIKNGFVKRVSDKEEFYYVIVGGLLEQSNNIVSVIAQEVGKGETLELAREDLKKSHELQKEKNYKDTMDFTEMEKELAKNLKEAKASQI